MITTTPSSWQAIPSFSDQLRVNNINAQNLYNSFEVAQPNPLNLSKTCAAGIRETKLVDSPSLKTLMKASSSCTPGAQKEKDNAANVALWDDCFFSNQENQHFAATQDNKVTLGNPVTYESFVGQPSGDSLAFLRCSALSFRPQASSTQDEKLALGCSAFSTSMLASISSIISCGKRIPLYVDLLFLCPVAIVPIFHGKCFNTYDDTACCPDDEVFKQKILDVFKHMALWYLNTKEKVKTTNAKPHSARNTYGVSNHNVNWSNIMACSHDTQTRPKFVYLFLGTPNEFPDSTPTVLRAEADSEDDARAKFPRWTLTFAAQIRTAAPCRLQIFSTDDGFMWVYEQRQPAPEVVHA